MRITVCVFTILMLASLPGRGIAQTQPRANARNTGSYCFPDLNPRKLRCVAVMTSLR